MDRQQLNRLNYLRRNYDFLSERERLELTRLEEAFENSPALEAQNRLDAERQRRADAENARIQAAQDRNRERLFKRAPEVGDGLEQQDLSQEVAQRVPLKSRPSKRSAHMTVAPQDLTPKQLKKYQLDKNGLPKLNKKGKLKKKRHILRKVGIGLLLLLLIMSGFFVYGYNKGSAMAGGAAKAEAFNGTPNQNGATNILLIGADQRPNNAIGSVHSDTIMVMQVGSKDGKIKLVSFMRDMIVNIPGVSSTNNTPDVKINTAYTIGEQNKPRNGADLLRQTLLTNFGINCQYYAVVDFSSFSKIIDTLFPGGVAINAQFSTINGQKMDEVPVPDDLAATQGMVSTDKTLTADQAAALGYPDGGGVFMMIKQGQQNMNGRTLLNYARFRHDDENDFGRVKRQQQVMQAVMSKVKNPLTLFTGSAALGTARALIETNIPNSFFLTRGLGVALTAGSGIESYTVPDGNNYTNGYDMYGGLGLVVNMQSARSRLQTILGN